MSKGVYKYTIGRPDVDLKEHSLPLTNFGGFNTWAAWQGTEDKAAVAGDFTISTTGSQTAQPAVDNSIFLLF